MKNQQGEWKSRVQGENRFKLSRIVHSTTKELVLIEERQKAELELTTAFFPALSQTCCES